MGKKFTLEEIEATLAPYKNDKPTIIQLAPDPDKAVDHAYLKQVGLNLLSRVEKPHVVWKRKRQ